LKSIGQVVVEKPWVPYPLASDLQAGICNAIKKGAVPPRHEIVGDKEDSGVSRRAEFNDCIPIVIGHQEEVQNCEFVC